MTKEEVVAIVKDAISLQSVQAPAPSQAAKVVQHEVAVSMEVESEVSDVIEAAKVAARKATSEGEMRRIDRLAMKKIRLISKLARKEEYM